jgi:UPF0271 protein
VDAVAGYDAALPVLCQPGSMLAIVASGAGLTVVGEGFADRGYRADGTLVPRSSPGALVRDPAAVAARATRMAVSKTVVAVDGALVPAEVRSICVHGDTPGAVEMAGLVRTALLGASLDVQAFA